jgi:arylsulfatase A-like enzyme
VRLVDVMPTVLDLLGIAAPLEVQGRSVAPLIRGGSAEETTVPSDYGKPERQLQSVRWQSLTYVADHGDEALFDTATDPGEEHDLARERPDVAAAMRARLEQWRTECAPLAARLGPRGAGATPGRDTLRQLRALGYVE